MESNIMRFIEYFIQKWCSWQWTDCHCHDHEYRYTWYAHAYENGNKCDKKKLAM